MINLTTVNFCGNGDGITAIYIDGDLFKYGDYYHDKIDEYITGFVDGLKYINGEDVINLNFIKLHDNHPLVYSTWELAEEPPKKLENIDVDEGK